MPGVTRIDVGPLRDALRACAKAAPKIRQRALREAAVTLRGDAQAEAPVRTGDLKASHTEDLSNPDKPVIGAGMSYAAAVHARHPTKAGWFRDVVIKRGPVVLRKALERALRDEIQKIKGAAGSGGSGGGPGRDANGRFISR
jgi:phage gpG-like protein